MRVAIVTNIPAPYRVPVFNRLALADGVELHVFYAMEREPDRLWELPPLEHAHTFLKDRMYTRSGRFIHNNPDILRKLKQFKPDVVVTTGYNPTHLYAFAYTRWARCHHVAMTDGTEKSELGLTFIHRWLRSFVLSRSRAFISASNGGRRLFAQYGVDDSSIFFSPLCANTAVDWTPSNAAQPTVDLLFSGRLVDVKNPIFFLEVANQLALRLGRCVRVAILGSGPLEPQLREKAAFFRKTVDVHFAGHVSQQDVPRWFLRAKLFLFPTLWDPWGIVANEACTAGVPVLISQHAGAAAELVQDGVNGYVLPLDVDRWTTAAVDLLSDSEKYAALSGAGPRMVAPYTFDNAALGIANASKHAAAPRVLCIQRRLTHYRVPLFEQLRSKLRDDGVVFELAYGQPNRAELAKADTGAVAWAKYVPCNYWLGGLLCWQNPGRRAKDADLVIVTQENKMLYNLWAIFWRRPKRLAYWGHGRNFQSAKPNSYSERFKKSMAHRSDWWFAYTGVTERRLVEIGFPRQKISKLNNTIDTSALIRQCNAVSDQEVDQYRNALLNGPGTLALFVGSLYEEKRIRFLLRAGERLAMLVPGFHLLILGNGPQRDLVEAAALRHPWLHFDGPRFGPDKALALRAADVLLNPGLVGLGILDSFAAGLPMITTNCSVHSPEIEYLRDGVNGLMTKNNLEDFVNAACALVTDPQFRARLASGAKEDASKYTLAHMADTFCEGVLSALAQPVASQ